MIGDIVTKKINTIKSLISSGGRNTIMKNCFAFERVKEIVQ